MSPVGGVGINYAIQDAVVAANLLSKPLLEQSLEEEHLAEVQRRREFPVKFIQEFQAILQKRILAPALASKQTTLEVPALVRWLVRIPILRDVPPRLIGLGFEECGWRVSETSSQAGTNPTRIRDVFQERAR